MGCAAVRGGIVDTDALDSTCVISGNFLLFDAHRILGVTVMLTETDRTGGHQPCQRAFGIAHTLGPLDDRFFAAPFERNAVALFFFDVAALIELHSCSNRTGNTDSIQTVFVAEPVGLVDGVKIIVAAVAAVGPQRLIFRPADNFVVVLDDTAAGDRTMIAGAGLDQILFSQCFTGELICRGIIAFLPVLGRKCTDAVDDVYKRCRAECAQAFAGKGVFAHDLEAALIGFLEGFHIGNDIQLLAGSFDNNSLEFFAAHNSACSGTAGSTVFVVHNGSEQNLLFTGGADVQNSAFASVLFFQLVIKFFTQNADILSGIQNLDFVILNIEIAPLRSCAFDDQGIPSGKFQLCTPDTARVGTGNHPGQRRFRNNHITAGGWGIRSGHGAGDINEFVFRGQRIDRGNTLIIKDLGAEASASDKLVGDIKIQGLCLDLTSGQVDSCYFFIISAAHTIPPEKYLYLSYPERII